MPNRHIRHGDNPDLTKERESCTFDTDELTANMYGSREAMLKRREISAKIVSDPDFVNPIAHEFLTREQRHEATAKKTKALFQRIDELCDANKPGERFHLINEALGIEGYPIALHVAMFLPALRGQAHEELAAEILPRALRHEIIGTYAQTEMGHGTNLRELETTATYDKATQEFVINTPTRRAMKWWPGNLGKHANYAIVVAQLLIDGRNYGPHNFLVQLRCESTHKPLPGLTIGDIGPKMGTNTVDNGFLAFDCIRIPRNNMLMKHCKVAPDGTYTAPMHAKMNYGTMIHVRSNMIYAQGHFFANAVIIATRYSAIRRQGRIEQRRGQSIDSRGIQYHFSGPEVQILDYQTQQYRIFPQIARTYAIMFAGKEVQYQYAKYVEGIGQGQTELLPDLHAILSGLKSVVTHMVALGIEQCRMSCGGHGYSDASGLPKLYAVQVAGCTYEGENMVMLQQTARYLMKAVTAAAEGKPLSHSVAYLAEKTKGQSLIGMEGPDASREHEVIIESLEHVARRLVYHAATLWKSRIASGESKERAWNAVTVEMNRAARVHTRLFMAHAFHRRVTSASESLRPILIDLFSLYLHYEAVDMAAHFLEDNHCTGQQMRYLKRRLYEDLAKLRPNVVSLVDSLEISDRELNSVLGRRDGNVYDALYEWAKKSELNYIDVLPAVHNSMLPMMEQNRAKL